MAIMVGINTVLIDNPQLTTRLSTNEKKGENPIKIVIDSLGKIPIDSNILKHLPETQVILGTTSKIDKYKENLLLEKGVIIIKSDGTDERVDLKKFSEELYKLQIDSILLEGGGNLNYSALQSGIVDKLLFFISPKIIGGEKSLTPIEGAGISLMKDALNINNMNILKFDDDILIEGYLWTTPTLKR